MPDTGQPMWRLGLVLALLLSAFAIFIGLPDFETPHTLISAAASSADARLSLIPTSDDLRTPNLTARDDYSCDADNPCSNHACCGGTGDKLYCGYGSQYCGDTCVSDCDAIAECGQFADPPGKQCPLNVCCSKFGFCGTTSDFCTNDCQSNCVEHPQPSGLKSDQDVRKRIVGYYEAWSARRACHAFTPSMLPVDALTHVNFAFASIEAETYEITTMDSATPADLFQTAADVKTFKSGNTDLEVWISIGGWTFSDNGTATQPLFGEISRDSAKREKFAQNVVKFMNQYGFDGLDIDWEYPKAPDRGGHDDDTANYVLLVQKLREVFDVTPRRLGLSITIPSSYWYLRGFDLPSMEPYLDWFNLMSYDLHGFWDRDNPIGSIVQGHTNLTEIKLAAELLWRVEIPPMKVLLGFGFYGRAFQLADPLCDKPGCLFGSAAIPGQCTDSAGILGYFEIMEILEGQQALQSVQPVRRNVIEPIHDEVAAVKYFKYNDDQWVSYDDETTFKQKIEWANNNSLGGIFAWSSDMDTQQYTGMSGVTGHNMSSLEYTLQNPKDIKAVAQNWKSQNGEACYISGPCKPKNGLTCGKPGYTYISYDRDDCDEDYGKPICCPVDAHPSSCTWRGHCHGQCHTGEVTLFESHRGGEPGESSPTKKCGMKAFCCKADHWAGLVEACEWNSCGPHCRAGFESVAMRRNEDQCGHGGVSEDYNYQNLCCPAPKKFHHCHWVGKGDCEDARCNAAEVQLDTDHQGNDTDTCGIAHKSKRNKALCCASPPDEAPFLPASLDKLFPADLHVQSEETRYEITYPGQKDSAGSTPSTSSAFGFVIVTGSNEAVASAKFKRDGTRSALHFLDCGKEQSRHYHTARFVCTADHSDNDCQDMLEGGLNGTIIEMPDGCGPAQYGVARALYVASNQLLPPNLANIANRTVMELAFDHDFRLVKRDGGDIYFRVDYSNAGGDYWSLAVTSDPKRKRSLDRRFWSVDISKWKDVFTSWFKLTRARSGSEFDVIIDETLYSSSTDCDGNEAYVDIRAKGVIHGRHKVGATIIGTISPELKIDEAYLATNTTVNARLDVDHAISGRLVLPRTTNSLESPVEADVFSHLGLVVLKPYMTFDMSLFADIDLTGNFSTSVSLSAQDVVQAWPKSAYDPFGLTDAVPVDNGFRGTVQAVAPRDGRLVVELMPHVGMTLELDQFDTNAAQLSVSADTSAGIYTGVEVEKSAARFRASLGKTKTSGQLYYHTDDQVIEAWDADGGGSRTINDAGHGLEMASGEAGYESGGGGGPDDPDISDNPTGLFQAAAASLFCSAPDGQCKDKPIICDSICNVDASYCESEDEALLARNSSSATLFPALNILAGGGGKPRDFGINLRDGGLPFEIKSRPYPTVSLLWKVRNKRDQVLKKKFEYVNTNPSCAAWDVTGKSISDDEIGSLGGKYVTEHILELQTIPAFLEAASSGVLTSGKPISIGKIDPGFFRDNWNKEILPSNLGAIGPYGGLKTKIPNERVFEALGSTLNRQNFVVAEYEMNGFKADLWDRNNPKADDNFYPFVQLWIYKCKKSKDFLRWIKAALAVFDYLENTPEVKSRLWDGAKLVHAQLQLIETHTTGGTGLAKAWEEFFPDLMEEIAKHGRQWIESRISYVTTELQKANAEEEKPDIDSEAAVVQILGEMGKAAENLKITGSVV